MALLQPKTDKLGKRLAAHLLRRTTYRITPDRIAAFAEKTPAEAILELFTFPALHEPKGPSTENGTFWLTDGPFSAADWSDFRRNIAVHMWNHCEVLKDTSIRQKMALFLKSTFVTEQLELSWQKFDYERLCMHFALGNIKTIAYKVTLDNYMLTFLNNEFNVKGDSNENYAREFLELFTILKGPQITAENYTNYTEQDVRAAARLLTGFTTADFDNKDPDTGLATGQALYDNHDIGNKQFSGAFQYKLIQGASSEEDMYRELQDFVNMIFDQIETAKAYTRKLYLFFVHDLITDEVENDIITPLAQELISNGYELRPIVAKLLTSKHFYDEDDNNNTDQIIGGKIKPPLELLFQTVSLFDADNFNGPFTTGGDTKTHGRRLEDTLNACGYPLYPLTVEGYPGYYKAPGFSKNWINTTTIVNRYTLEKTIRRGKDIDNEELPYFKIDNFATYFDTYYTHQEYADIFLTQIIDVLFPEQPDADRFNYFKNILLGGLSEVNWMFEWQTYKASGDDSSVNVVLEDLYIALLRSPEFQTY